MKTCIKCKTEKALDQFYKNPKAPDGHLARCKPCRLEDSRQGYRDNREKRLARYHEYRAKNKDDVNRRKRENRNLKRQETNAENRRYREANREKEAERQRRWRKENPERVLEYNFRRRVRKLNAQRFLVTDKDLKRILSQCCCYCGTADNITIEHVVPLYKGGTHSVGNLAPACGICNSSKGARFVSEWKLARQWDMDVLA